MIGQRFYVTVYGKFGEGQAGRRAKSQNKIASPSTAATTQSYIDYTNKMPSTKKARRVLLGTPKLKSKPTKPNQRKRDAVRNTIGRKRASHPVPPA